MKENKSVKVKPSKIISGPESFNKLLLPVIILVTIFAFYSSLNNGFTNWDDEDNVTKNTSLIAFHADTLASPAKYVFGVSKDIAMYSPVVRLSYLVQYGVWADNPWPYHLLNLLLHLLNASLVFYFIWLLCRQQWVAFITALLFAIHPMHVESVAWVTGRIDEFSSLFYLAGLCTYVLYLNDEKRKWQFYTLTFVLFAFSLLSKASAVTFPVVLFALDYFLDRKITTKTVLAKAPFFLLSLIFGFIAIYVQQGLGMRQDLARYSFFDWGLFICYAITEYLWKLIAPVNLACIYDYPFKHPSSLFSGLQMYPLILYVAPVVIGVLGFLVYKSRKFGKDVLFGFGFFLINIALVLPGLAVRHAIIADRYTYISYIGIFFILAGWLNNLWQNKPARFEWLRTPAMVVLGIVLLWFSYLTATQCDVWHDSVTLWSDAIVNTPNDYPDVLQSAISNKNNTAVIDTGKAVLRMPTEAYYNRGSAYLVYGKNDEALRDFDSVLAHKPDFAECWYNRGNAYLHKGKNEEAINNYNTAIRLKPDFAEAYSNRGYGYAVLKRTEDAVNDFNTAIRIKPDYADAYSNRGNYYYTIKQYDDAIKDYGKAIFLKPASGEAYNNRGVAYLDIQQFKPALDDLKKAKQLGLNVDATLINNLEAKVAGGAK